MIDARLRSTIDPTLNEIGRRLAPHLSANTISIAGFATGMLAVPLIAAGMTTVPALLIVLNRAFDGLDGAVARQRGITDLGGFLDIVLDFIFYAAIVFAVCLARPSDAVFGAFVIFSFIGTGATFLAYSIFAEKRQLRTDVRGIKSIYYLGGLTEGFETIVFLLLICLVPAAFAVAATVFGILCWITAVSRIYTAANTL